MTATPEDAAGDPVPRNGIPGEDVSRWDEFSDDPDAADEYLPGDGLDLDIEFTPADHPDAGSESLPANEPLSADARAAADAFFAALRAGAAPPMPPPPSPEEASRGDEPEGTPAAMAVLLDEPRPVDQDAERDWAWVEEWRAGGEPTPWGPGIAFAAFVALVIGTAVYVLSSGLRDAPLWAFLSNIVAAAFLAPALWMARRLPVFRWISLGGFIGVIVAWLALLLFPVPTF